MFKVGCQTPHSYKKNDALKNFLSLSEVEPGSALGLLGNDLAMLSVFTTEIINRAKKIEFVYQTCSRKWWKNCCQSTH